MRRSIIYIKLILLLGLIGFLFSFTKKRNEARKISKIDVVFVDNNSPFITFDNVNKLLIQSYEKVSDISKEALALREMEYRLIGNPMIRDAQVYVTIDGKLCARIEQREPIGRVSATPDYYLDSDGKVMSLSEVYSARVPIITGASESEFSELTDLLLKIKEDEFMKRSVIGVHQRADGEIELELRKVNFNVFFGKPVHIEKKFQNFKAFYKKTKKDSTLYGYNKVNLKFDSQVIATKK